jgi:hypothetical protein
MKDIQPGKESTFRAILENIFVFQLPITVRSNIFFLLLAFLLML